MRRRTEMWRTVAFAVLLVMVAAACVGGGDDSGAGDGAFFDGDLVTEASGESASDDGGDAMEETAPASAEEPQASLGSGGVQAAQPAPAGRQIIFTADLTVAVADVPSASAEATQVIESLGGFVFGQQSTADPVAVNTITFKIDPANFQTALAQLGGIGELRTQSISADDVTERVVDLESRIVTAEASVERLRALLESADSVQTIAELESQLLDRETQLETLRGQLRTLRDAVDLATIRMTITEALSNPQVVLEVTGYPGDDDEGASCPGEFGFTVEQGDAVTVCFEIRNVGDTPLADLELVDSVLGVALSDLRVVFGDPAARLEPGQSVILATTTVAERNLRTQTRVSAVPVNAEGQLIEARPATTTASLFVDARDPGGLPGFGDGFSGSVELLQSLGRLIVFLAGAVLPFIWIIPVVWGIRWWRAQRAAARAEAAEDAIQRATAEVSASVAFGDATDDADGAGPDGAAADGDGVG